MCNPATVHPCYESHTPHPHPEDSGMLAEQSGGLATRLGRIGANPLRPGYSATNGSNQVPQRSRKRLKPVYAGSQSSDLVGQWKPGEEPTEKFPVACQREFPACLGVSDRATTIDDRSERRRIGHDC